MAPNMLALAALAGSAIATQACPLSVSIVDTVDHVATVAVTNSGSEAITVFKGNTVLSDHDTLDVVATKTGKYDEVTLRRLLLFFSFYGFYSLRK